MSRPLIPINRSQYDDEIRKLNRKYKKELSRLDEKLKLFRKTCNHENTKYVPDASGNNDSYTICEICGFFE